MTTTIIAVSQDIIEQAFAALEADQSARVQPNSGAARLRSRAEEVEAAIGDAWIKVKSLIERCVSLGKAIVKEEVDAFMQYVETTSKELGARAKEFREGLLEKIRQMIDHTFALMLKAMRAEILVGQRKLLLKSVNLEQKLVFSSSLQVSITSLCEFVGGGELTVTGSYEVAT